VIVRTGITTKRRIVSAIPALFQHFFSAPTQEEAKLYLSIKNQSKTGKLLLTEGYSQTMRIIQRAPINANISSG